FMLVDRPELLDVGKHAANFGIGDAIQPALLGDHGRGRSLLYLGDVEAAIEDHGLDRLAAARVEQLDLHSRLAGPGQPKQHPELATNPSMNDATAQLGLEPGLRERLHALVTDHPHVEVDAARLDELEAHRALGPQQLRFDEVHAVDHPNLAELQLVAAIAAAGGVLVLDRQHRDHPLLRAVAAVYEGLALADLV